MSGEPEDFIQSQRQLRGGLQVWVRSRLWLQVAVGLFGGLATGFLLGPEIGLVTRETAAITGGWLALPEIFFLGLIAMGLVPIVLVTIVAVTLVASSIGAPGTPGVGMVILANVVAGLGIPTTGIAIILGIDRILDMCRTTVNVTGDLVARVLFRNVAVAPSPGESAAAPGVAEVRAASGEAGADAG